MNDAQLQQMREEVSALTSQGQYLTGKVIGLEVSLLTLAREWGNSPQKAIEALHNVMETMDDPAKSQFPPGSKETAMELIEQVSSVLHSRNL
ncbi:hypothetical protein [Stenotrophomonas rhizophila]|uniref:hypothetical protein n=1 Tax=Stenotrophomonas rhizophila TaxID=216778 RepID=UPI0033945227